MQEDKALGAWLGLACGDALGQAAKSLKPETIKQFYKRMDAYQDVRPFIGKGVRTYRMQGLYGCPTQMALALAEVLVAHKGFNAGVFADTLVRLSVGGPETYFGAFRRPEGAFFKTVSELPNRSDPEDADLSTAFGSYFPLGVTVALYYGRDSATFRKTGVAVASMMSGHSWEIAGTALAAYLTLRFAEMETPPPAAPFPDAESLIRDAAAFAAEIEKSLAPSFEEDLALLEAFSQVLQAMAQRWASSGAESIEPWMCEEANRFLKQPVRHAAQAQTLTLLPLALSELLARTDGFESTLARVAGWGREADKLGALAGAWAGAWYGLDAIPDSWKTGLVNNREVRARGEALIRRRAAKGKELTAMELGLTQKEAEEKRKYLPREPKKKTRDRSGASVEDLFNDMGVEWEEDPLAEIRDDPRKWRQFEREKSKKKKERRRTPKDSGWEP